MPFDRAETLSMNDSAEMVAEMDVAYSIRDRRCAEAGDVTSQRRLWSRMLASRALEPGCLSDESMMKEH